MKNYDYSQSGWYFVTICTQNRENLFGEIVDNNIVGARRDAPEQTGCNRPISMKWDQPISMNLNQYGKIIEDIWKSLPKHHPVELDMFQIMPNHVHFILLIVSASRPNNTGGARPAPTTKLGIIIGSFKSECTKQIRKIYSVGVGRARPIKTIWQRNYYEHIIRNEDEYVKIKEYIKLNPSMWEKDRNNQNNMPL